MDKRKPLAKDLFVGAESLLLKSKPSVRPDPFVAPADKIFFKSKPLVRSSPFVGPDDFFGPDPLYRSDPFVYKGPVGPSPFQGRMLLAGRKFNLFPF